MTKKNKTNAKKRKQWGQNCLVPIVDPSTFMDERHVCILVAWECFVKYLLMKRWGFFASQFYLKKKIMTNTSFLRKETAQP